MILSFYYVLHRLLAHHKGVPNSVTLSYTLKDSIPSKTNVQLVPNEAGEKAAAVLAVTTSAAMTFILTIFNVMIKEFKSVLERCGVPSTRIRFDFESEEGYQSRRTSAHKHKTHTSSWSSLFSVNFYCNNVVEVRYNKIGRVASTHRTADERQ